MEINDIKTTKRFNKYYEQGLNLLRRSIKYLGLGRSILVDKNNVIISGNAVYETAKKQGVKKVICIETTGDTLVVVKRTDIDADSKTGLELQLVDNLSTEQNLNWDTDWVIECMNKSYSFDPRKWNGYNCVIKELSLEDYLKSGVTIVEKKTSSKQDSGENEFIQLTLF